MIPRIVHQFWTGRPNCTLDEHAAALRSCNPRWQVWQWDAHDLPPLDPDLRHIWTHAETYSVRPDVLRAVIARLVILDTHGGVCVDVDTWPLRSFDELPDLPCWIAGHDAALGADIAVLGAVPHHPLIVTLTDVVRQFAPRSMRYHPGIEALVACALPPLLPSALFYPQTETEKEAAICWNPHVFAWTA